MPSLSLTSTEVVWIVIAFIGLIVISVILRFFLSLAVSLIRTVVVIGVILIILYILYALFL